MPQSVKDALADAETLLVALDNYYDPAYVAGRIGDKIRRRLAGEWWGNLPDCPSEAARCAAHFAFRAVPGLRG